MIMASGLKFPDPFNFNASNLALEWDQWSRQFRWYILATRKDEEDEEVIVGVLLSLLGREGMKIYDTLPLTAAEAKKKDTVLKAFETYFQPLKSEVFDRFLFHRRHQQPGEPFDTWLVELRGMVKSCNYGAAAIVESILRDQIVLGVANEQVREKLLFEAELSLAKACSIVRACESASSQLTQMASRLDSSVHHLNDRPTKAKPPSSGASRQGGQLFVNWQCYGRRHQKGQCFAANIVCFACGQKGHFANRCPNTRSRHASSGSRQMAPPPSQKKDNQQNSLRAVAR